MHSLLLLLLFLLLSQACRAESHIVLSTGTVREEARGSSNCVCVAGAGADESTTFYQLCPHTRYLQKFTDDTNTYTTI